MHPILVNLGLITIHSYGVCMALAFISATGWTWLEVKRKGLDVKFIPDLACAVFLGALIGSRLLYVLLYLPYFLSHPWKIFMFWEGGMVFSGGALFGAFLGWHEVKKHKMPALPWLDAVAPSLALGEAIGRLGCLSAGCCYGQPCDLPWAITFTDLHSLAEPLNIPLHPTQAYHSLSGIITFAILLIMRSRFQQRPGQLIGLFLTFFCLARFSVEHFRADFRGEFGPFSVTQLIYASFLIIGLILFFKKHTTQG